MDLERFIKTGLTVAEADERRKEFGRNVLKEKPPPSDLELGVRQFQNPLVVVLMGAGILTLGLQHYSDSVVIGLAVVVNTILGFVQERNAQRGLEALKKLISPQAVVIRDGEQKKIDARELVPGDVVELYEGDKIPADGLVMQANSLLINEAILTGESVAVGKERIANNELRIMEEKILSKEIAPDSLFMIHDSNTTAQSQLFMGTVVTAGAGKMVVSAIGMKTELGKIAESLGEEQERQTPLEKRLSQLAKWLTVIVLLMALGVFGFGMLTGRDTVEMFTLAVAIAVAAIPEGMVVALTAILALGMQRILKRKAVVRKLVAAETLGSVTVVCVDKTGTLTEGQMRVVEVDFVDQRLGMRGSALANDLRDGTEVARWEWLGQKAAVDDHEWIDPQIMVEESPRSDSIPFSTEARFLATRHGKEIFVVGAPEVVLGWTTDMIKNQRAIKNKSKIQNVKLETGNPSSSSGQGWKLEGEKLIEEWGMQGRRMVGLAYENSRSEKEAIVAFEHLRKHRHDKVHLKWLGLIGYADPVREGVKEALEEAGKAGIGVKVITGDYRITAEAVMSELGLKLDNEEVMEGIELAELSDEQLQSRVGKVRLFARTKPEQKLRIVKALKARKEVVAMMGDGVNDAPALTAADIGIVVGDASEVAREAADMVLLDSNFRTILAAVAEGRGIFDNLKKIIMYLLSDTFSELIVIMGSLVMGWPLAVTAVQVLWINLVNDGLPSLALTVDPRDKDILKRKPVDSGLPLLDRQMMVFVGVGSMVSALVGLGTFGWWYPLIGEEIARTMVFGVLALDSLWYAFSCRTLHKNLWEESLGENKWLVGSVVSGLVLIVAPVYVPWLRDLLGLATLGWQEWLWVGVMSFGVVVAIEAVKYLYKQSR